MTFKDECMALLGEYGNSWRNCVYDSTEIIFNLKNDNNHEELITKPIKLIPHKFYLMEYIYIKDKYFTEKYSETKDVPYLKIWCPIYFLGFKLSDKIIERQNTNKKLIMYALNLDYLPYKYRITLFDEIFKRNKEYIDRNKNFHTEKNGNVLNEYPLKNLSALTIYNMLKTNGGYEYCLTAYDPTKIVKFSFGQPELYSISTTIAQRIMFVDCKLKNKKNIIETLREREIESEREKIELILKSLDDLLTDIESDEKALYKKFRLLENYFEIV